jgi:hypothetical protein
VRLPEPRIIRAILQSSPTRSIHSSSGDPNPHRVTNTRAQRSSISAIVIASGSGARPDAHAESAATGLARTQAGSEVGAVQRAVIFPTQK